MFRNLTSDIPDEDSKSVHYSCRLNTTVYRFLVDEAEQKNISMNNLLNQIASEYVLKKNFEKIGSTLMCKDVLKGVFEMADDKNLIKFASKLGSNNALEYVEMLYHDINKVNVLKFLDLWSRRFYGYEHKNHDNIHKFSIPHDINTKYSVFAKEFITSFVESSIKKPVKIQSTSRAVIFSVAD
jgi:predicted DNA-binding ribbon-helix-helix protein